MIVIRLNAKKTAVPIATNSLLTCLEVYGRTISRYLGRREFFYRYQPYMLINYRQLHRIFQRKKSIFRTSALKICFLSLCLTFPHFPQLYFCSASPLHIETHPMLLRFPPDEMAFFRRRTVIAEWRDGARGDCGEGRRRRGDNWRRAQPPPGGANVGGCGGRVYINTERLSDGRSFALRRIICDRWVTIKDRETFT